MRKAVLLMSLSESTYKLLESLCVPKTIESSDYNALIAVLQKYFAPPSAYFMARLKFFSAKKNSENSARDCAARLRGLSAECKFGTEIEVVLRDIFVCGYDSGLIQDRMMEEDASLRSVTLSDLVELATGKEATLAAHADRRQQAAAVVILEPSDDINFFKKRSFSRNSKERNDSAQSQVQKPPQTNDKCAHCGRKNHLSQKCRYKNLPCHNCHVVGHLANVCPQRSNQYHQYQSKYLA